ncbi:MAG: sugar phosphate isomerase/epimerase [Candidatus Krumholzibacteriota bacterium]|nr:sugar phosphate isomerase/epimerase [Candidatus Krumholzibacteriota bacterium]
MPHRFFAHVPLAWLPRYEEALARLPVGLELLVDHEALDPAFRTELERLAASLGAAGRPCRFHAPFRDLSPGGHDPEAVALARRRLEAALELAPRFGVAQIVAHTAWDPDGYALEAEAWRERSARFWGPLGERAAALGCRFALENVFDRDPDALAALLDRLPETAFGVNLDLGHWHAYSRTPLAGWLERLGGRLLSLHLHDNAGRSDQHLPLGRGSVPWEAVFAAVRELGRPLDWTVENHSLEEVLASAAFLAEHSRIPEFAHLADLTAGSR